MDYEFRITLAEKELAHLREMQDLMRGRMNAHDTSIEALRDLQAHTEANIQANQAAIAELTRNVNQLVQALLREHTNGKP